MRRQHFDAFAPICPLCLHNGQGEYPLNLVTILRESTESIEEGILHCSNLQCQREYPIIDGIPILLCDVSELTTHQSLGLLMRADLSVTMSGLLNDSMGANSEYDLIRQQLSCYAFDHYEDLSPESDSESGSIARVMNLMFEHVAESNFPCALDIGCSVGRGSFQLAERTRELVLGVDKNIAMLRMAQHVLHQQQVNYDLRRVGIVYERREFPVSFPNKENVDFWCCDATALPFRNNMMDFVVSLNVLDCLSGPILGLREMARLVRPKGTMLLTTPFDWSSGATAMEAWIGGHSQRGPNQGRSEQILRALLTPGAHPQSLTGVRIRKEWNDLSWQVRLHERSRMMYRLFGLFVDVLEAENNPEK